MKKHKEQDLFFKHKEPRYYRKYRDKLDFALEDMKNFWDDTYFAAQHEPPHAR